MTVKYLAGPDREIGGLWIQNERMLWPGSTVYPRPTAPVYKDYYALVEANIVKRGFRFGMAAEKWTSVCPYEFAWLQVILDDEGLHDSPEFYRSMRTRPPLRGGKQRAAIRG